MRNDIRNTIVLTCLLLVIIIIKVSLAFNHSKKMKFEEERLSKNKSELKSLEYVIIDTMQVYMIKKKIAMVDSWQSQYGKYYIKEDNSKLTWAYITSIVNNYSPGLDINFESFNEKEENTAFKEYKLAGTGDLSSLHTFINHFENQSMLYLITDISLTEATEEMEDGQKRTLVSFLINIQSSINPSGKDFNEVGFRLIKPYSSINVFMPKIYPPQTNPYEETKISAEGLVLLSLTPNSAFVKAKDNHVYILKIGSPVAYGYLSSINWRDQSITFKINKIGLYKDFTIKLNKE